MEKFMEEYFIAHEKEFSGVPVTKDNFEQFFEVWIEKLEADDWFRFGELYALLAVKSVEKLRQLNK